MEEHLQKKCLQTPLFESTLKRAVSLGTGKAELLPANAQQLPLPGLCSLPSPEPPCTYTVWDSITVGESPKCGIAVPCWCCWKHTRQLIQGWDPQSWLCHSLGSCRHRDVLRLQQPQWNTKTGCKMTKIMSEDVLQSKPLGQIKPLCHRTWKQKLTKPGVAGLQGNLPVCCWLPLFCIVQQVLQIFVWVMAT